MHIIYIPSQRDNTCVVYAPFHKLRVHSISKLVLNHLHSGGDIISLHEEDIENYFLSHFMTFDINALSFLFKIC